MISIQELSKRYGSTLVLDKITLSIPKGSILGIVGESGSGKSTLARLLLRLENPTSGSITFASETSNFRKQVQIVFQDPYASLNPTHTVQRIIEEGPRIHRMSVEGIASFWLQEVGLDDTYLSRYPHQLSGGQRQRVSIARALAVEPDILVLDEPTSALDLYSQHQVLHLLKTLQKKKNLTYLFITHNISLLPGMADHVAVLQNGKVIEHSRSNDLLEKPQNAYTKTLIKSQLYLPKK